MILFCTVHRPELRHGYRSGTELLLDSKRNKTDSRNARAGRYQIDRLCESSGLPLQQFNQFERPCARIPMRVCSAQHIKIPVRHLHKEDPVISCGRTDMVSWVLGASLNFVVVWGCHVLGGQIPGARDCFPLVTGRRWQCTFHSMVL